MVTVKITGPRGGGKTIAARALEKVLIDMGKTVAVVHSERDRNALYRDTYGHKTKSFDYMIEDYDAQT